jgi:hypothetical protein
MAQGLELESLLYAIGMESSTAYEYMDVLCDLLAVPFPPKNKPKEKNEIDSKRFCKGEAGVWASIETELKPAP